MFFQILVLVLVKTMGVDNDSLPWVSRERNNDKEGNLLTQPLKEATENSLLSKVNAKFLKVYGDTLKLDDSMHLTGGVKDDPMWMSHRHN